MGIEEEEESGRVDPGSKKRMRRRDGTTRVRV